MSRVPLPPSPTPGDSIRATDADLVRQAQQGDGCACAALCDRHRPGLVRFITWIISDADEAESLAQETLTRAYQRLSDVDPDLAFDAWLRGIALNLTRNHFRRQARHARPVDPSRLDPAPAAAGRRQGVLSGILREERHVRLWQALAELPQAYREALVLHYVEGLDYVQMSRITGTSAVALRARALRGRKLLRSSLGSVVETWLRNSPDDVESLSS